VLLDIHGKGNRIRNRAHSAVGQAPIDEWLTEEASVGHLEKEASNGPTDGSSHKTQMDQLSIIGFVGKDVQGKHLPNGTAVVNFSVATKPSWKDYAGEWKTQWHNVVAYGHRFTKLANRLLKGTHVFV
jgi:Single-strand binding protein family